MPRTPPSALLPLVSALALAACAHRTPAPAGAAAPHLTNLRQLTTDGDNGEAYFSWDDRQLIWQSNRGGEACDKIWVMNTDGSGKQRVSPAHGAHTCSFFLPGDRQVVFASTSHLPGDCPPRPEIPGHRYLWPLFPYDIFQAARDGSGLRRLTDNPKYDAEPVVAPDGRIVFGSQREGDFDIYTMDADGSDVRRLTDRYGYDGGPWWSPDGTRIAWRAWHPETPEERALWKDCMDRDYIVPVPLDLWVMDADGGNKRRLTDNGATNWAPSWHPDGRRLVFSSNVDDWHPELGRFGHNFELYLIGVDGTGLTRLTDNDVFDSFPMFSHDGTKLVWGSNRNPQKPRATDIYLADWVE
jgi:Tol biopolymer transport system component